MRRFKLGLRADVPAAIVFLDSMAKTDTVNELIMRSMLSRPSAEVAAEAENAEALYARIQSHALAPGEVKDCDNWSSMMEQLLMGDTIILLEGCEKSDCVRHAWGERHAQSASQQHRQSSEDRKRDL
nr:spore germination protein [Paenibacillus polymyxa]